MRGLYNVLEKLRAQQPLNDKENAILDKGLVSILKQLTQMNRGCEVVWSRFDLPQVTTIGDYLSSDAKGREQAHLPTAAEVKRLSANKPSALFPWCAVETRSHAANGVHPIVGWRKGWDSNPR